MKPGMCPWCGRFHDPTIPCGKAPTLKPEKAPRSKAAVTPMGRSFGNLYLALFKGGLGLLVLLITAVIVFFAGFWVVICFVQNGALGVAGGFLAVVLVGLAFYFSARAKS